MTLSSMPASSSISTQIVARTALWTFIFSAEVLIKAFMESPNRSFDYYYAVFVASSVGFLLTLRLGKSDVARDFRDLWFYDVVVQCLGLMLFRMGYGPAIYISFGYTLLFLKFSRLIWPAKSSDGQTLLGWPVFGPFGYFYQRQRAPSTLPQRPHKSQDMAVYAFIVSSFVGIFFLLEIGIKMHLAYWAALALALIAFNFDRFIQHLDEMQQKHEETIKRLAVAEAVAEKSQELAAKNAELELKNIELAEAKAKEEQVSLALLDAAHDLKSPIVILTFAAEDIAQATTPEARQAALQTYHVARRKVSEAITHTMFYAQVATNLMESEIKAVDVGVLMRALRDEWQEPAFEKGVEVIKTYPRGHQRPLVAGDHMVILRILRNLLVNAITHAAPCDRILMSLRKRGNHSLLLQIWDVGVGIADADGPDGAANFADFAQRVYRAKQSSGDGRSLGINIVRQLCEVAHFPITMRSRLGHGTVFSILLPLASEELIQQTANERAQLEKNREQALFDLHQGRSASAA